MKTIAIILTLTFASSLASASFMQKTCKDIRGYTSSANGHVDNHFTLTKIEYSNGSEPTLTPIEVDYQNYTIENLENIQLVNESFNSCDSGNSTGGFASYRGVTFEKVKITKKNRSLFSKDVFGVSEDRLSVTAELLCERHVNNQVFCEKD